MPISDRLLAEPRNSFVAVTGQASVGQAVAALLANDGRDWWHLVVRRLDNTWAATTVSQLYAALAPSLPRASDGLVADWPGLIPATTVEQTELDDQQAQGLAQNSASGLILVLAGGNLVGLVYAPRRQTNLSPLSVGKLTELAGEAINLKDYGPILLAASKKRAPPSRPAG